jgi:hypothetical protein
LSLSLPQETSRPETVAVAQPAETKTILQRAGSLALAEKLAARKSLRAAARLAAELSAASNERN